MWYSVIPFLWLDRGCWTKNFNRLGIQTCNTWTALTFFLQKMLSLNELQIASLKMTTPQTFSHTLKKPGWLKRGVDLAYIYIRILKVDFCHSTYIYIYIRKTQNRKCFRGGHFQRKYRPLKAFCDGAKTFEGSIFSFKMATPQALAFLRFTYIYIYT